MTRWFIVIYHRRTFTGRTGSLMGCEQSRKEKRVCLASLRLCAFALSRNTLKRGLQLSAALKAIGALPENVNYAVKSSYLLSFLESVPEVAAKLKEPETKERKFEEVVKSAEQAAVLVLVY